jgi:hypothetical protein
MDHFADNRSLVFEGCLALSSTLQHKEEQESETPETERNTSHQSRQDITTSSISSFPTTIPNDPPPPYTLHTTITRMASPSRYRSHPLFALRLAQLAISIIGIILGTVTAVLEYASFRSIWTVHIALYCISMLVACADLIDWAIHHSDDQDTSSAYAWPLKRTILAEILLVVAFIALYAGELGQFSNMGYRMFDRVDILIVHDTVAVLVTLGLDVVCLGQLIAARKGNGGLFSFGRRGHGGHVRLAMDEDTTS